MKFSDKEVIRKFVELVKSGAGLRAFKSIGLGRIGLQEHIKYLAEYERVLAEHETIEESLEKEEPQKASSIRDATTVAKEKNNDTGGIQPNIRVRNTEGTYEER